MRYVLACLVASIVPLWLVCDGCQARWSNLAGHAGDLVARRAQEAPASRWYSLDELGIPATLDARALGLAGHVEQERRENLIELPDPACREPPAILSDEVVIANTESWEAGVEGGKDSVGYPSVVHNVHGEHPDSRYFLYYAIHDAHSGIALAVGNDIAGPYTKLAQLDRSRGDSRVLRAPARPRKSSHFSSPVVLWNADRGLWHLYFHYYSNEWERGAGHQRTALATTTDLASGRWTIARDEQGRYVSVLPVTRERWMNSQSTYHSIHRLPNGLWLAFLRGVGGEYLADGTWRQDTGKLGFALSPDGQRWAEVEGNPVIVPDGARGGRDGVFRPLFVATRGPTLVVCWGASLYYDRDPQMACGETEDLRHISPIAPPLGPWPVADGAASLHRSGQDIQVFYGNRRRIYRVSDVGCAPRHEPAAGPQK